MSPTRAARRVALAAPLLFVCTAAHAEPPREPVDGARMSRETERYFDGEKSEAWVFAGVGAGALGAGAALYAAGDARRRGVAYPLAAVGLVELAAGLVLLWRTDAQVHDLQLQLGQSPAAFREAELARMKKVEREFVWLEVTELALTVVGLGLATYGGFAQEPLVAGLGTGLAAQSAIMLTFDHFAAERARRYTRALEALRPADGPPPLAPPPRAALGWSVRF
ncbi:MAG: hypothetical protein KC657_03230 [Myxococcales bacterium]|nr:hypothetical protein [Myxococcales bacterium]